MSSKIVVSYWVLWDNLLDLILSRHAEERVRLRAMIIELIKNVLNSPNRLFFDFFH